jgi:hypothetical protein
MSALKALLNNNFAPLTFSLGFLEMPFQMVVDEFIRWKRELDLSVIISPIDLPLERALLKLEPLTTPHSKQLLMSTKSVWTAYFDNGTNCGDPFPPIGYLSQRLHCRGLAVTCTPQTKVSEGKGERGTYGAVQFGLFAPEPRDWLNYERYIVAMNDGGKWKFEASGNVQPFERVERYKARRIRDRFTDELLEDYCQALGIRLFDPKFYGPSAVLIEENLDHFKTEPAVMTLAEARWRLGLES